MPGAPVSLCLYMCHTFWDLDHPHLCTVTSVNTYHSVSHILFSDKIARKLFHFLQVWIEIYPLLPFNECGEWYILNAVRQDTRMKKLLLIMHFPHKYKNETVKIKNVQLRTTVILLFKNRIKHNSTFTIKELEMSNSSFRGLFVPKIKLMIIWINTD